MDSSEKRFSQLASRLLDGACTNDERVELSRLGSQHPEWAAGIVDEVMVHALLKWHSGNVTDEFVPTPAPPEFAEGISEKAKKGRRIDTARSYLWGIAALLLLSCGLLTWKAFSGRRVPAVIADIVDPNGVHWAENSTALGGGATIIAGRLVSLAGEYTLQFHSGPTVRVIGPASLDIKSKMLIQLEQGQVTAKVPKSSIGFTIKSPLANVIDQGTQFGISVGNDRANVVVFDGKVDLQSNGGGAGDLTRLIQGDSVRIDKQGALARVADVRRDVQGRWWTEDRSPSFGQVIASVADNIRNGGQGGRTFVCYQTTFEGLHEDALAYSDNPYHEWNGLTASGLPDFLLGADYVKTFNDYRYMETYELRVELARPANLYVFFDDRVDVPDWLKRDFEDTGVKIGLDEGRWGMKPGEPGFDLDTNTTAKGGGNSIDNIFSVWRRRCVNGGTISLGSLGTAASWAHDRIGYGGKGGRAMYGVAATPLDNPAGSPAPAVDTRRHGNGT